MGKKAEKTAAKERAVWERQDGETSQAYAAFCVYRDLPYMDPDDVLRAIVRRNRTLAEVAERMGCTNSNVEKMSTKYRWNLRVHAYDEFLDEIHRQEREADIIAMHRLHAKIAQRMVDKAARKFLLVNEADMSISDAIRMFELGVKYERLSRGDTTDNQSITLGKETQAGMASLVKSLQARRREG